MKSKSKLQTDDIQQVFLMIMLDKLYYKTISKYNHPVNFIQDSLNQL